MLHELSYDRFIEDGDALGQPLAYSYMFQETIYTVALVVDVPSNTHLPFELVVPSSYCSR